MTRIELNRDIKRLFRAMKIATVDEIETKIRPEFRRLYGADKEFAACTKNSVLRLMIINRKFHIVPTWEFGIDVNENRL